MAAPPRPSSAPLAAPPKPVVKPAGGGGGGGPIDPGSPSANGDLPLPGGRTPAGVVPGTGSGSGGGVGPGEGGGRGGGAGGGTGPGTGTGSGPGVGPGAGGEGGEGDGFSSRVADRREPVVIFKGNLEYPSSAVADGVEGVVKLRVLVSKRGAVEKVTVVESGRDRRLDAAAVEFVKGWRYRPAVQDGEPRSVYTYAVVEFELK
jgi:protein TonB